MLMKLSDVCQVDLAELTKANTPITVDQLRKVLKDPVVGQLDVSVDELRSAVDLAPLLKVWPTCSQTIKHWPSVWRKA